MTRLPLLLLLSGCALLSQPESYYGDDWDPPSVTGVGPDQEFGNIGGQRVTITGSNFGEDPNFLVVEFDDDAAAILSVTDDAIEVVVPPGPISGGSVAVRVATRTGYQVAENAYNYEVGDLEDDEVGYVQINNYWHSCYGGQDPYWVDVYGVDFCADISWAGYTGFDGRSEGLTFAYPRQHTEYVGMFGGTDHGNTDWSFEYPGNLSYTFGTDNLHQDLGPVSLTNAYWEGDRWCAHLDDLATFRYGGGVEGFEAATEIARDVAVEGKLNDESCGSGQVEYDMSRVDFCSRLPSDGVESWVYNADWPVVENFFAGGEGGTGAANVSLSMTSFGISGEDLVLPEPIEIFNREGMEDGDTSTSGAHDLWSLVSVDGCYDQSGDGEGLDDRALSFA